MRLREKASRALLWSLAAAVGQYGVQAVVSLVLTRLLMPRDVGMVGILWILIAVGQCLIDGGFGQALLQKSHPTSEDESSVFWFSVSTACTAVVVLWVAAPWIARFYGLPALEPLTRAISLNLPLAALGLVPATLLSKRLDLKAHAKATFIAAIPSAVIGIGMAYGGYGVWSLVAHSLSQNTIRTAALWRISAWRPRLVVRASALQEMLPLGSRVMAAGVLDAIFRNLYSAAIGKVFSLRDVGYYMVATRIPTLLGDSLITVVSRVTLPVYPTLPDDLVLYRTVLQKALAMMVAINTPLMVGIGVMAEPLVRAVLTEKWLPAVPYLQLYCVLRILMPLHYGNLEALLGLGRSDICLRLELLAKFLSAANLAISYRWGIEGLLMGQCLATLITVGLQVHYVGQLVRYTMWHQLRDLGPSVFASLLMGAAILLSRQMIRAGGALEIGLATVVGVVTFGTLCWAFRVSAFRELVDAAKRVAFRASA